MSPSPLEPISNSLLSFRHMRLTTPAMIMSAAASSTTAGYSSSTIVVGLNGALQKRFVLAPTERLVPGNVHRARDMHVGVGGKGQDVAVTLSCLRFSGDLKLVQFIGTSGEGDLVYQMLQELLGQDAMQLTVRSASGMRTCTSIVAMDSTTELVEPSGVVTAEEMNELLEKLSPEQASALCIMGSMLPGCPEETYADIYDKVATSKTLCLIDSVAGLKPLLQRIASRKVATRGSTILKVNAAELCRLASIDRSGKGREDHSETSGVAVSDIIQATTQFLDKNAPFAATALTAIAITDGAHTAYLAVMPVAPDDEFRLFELPVAKLLTMGEEGEAGGERNTHLYPIGAGDAVAAGTLAAWRFLTAAPDDPPCLPLDVQTVLEGNQSPATRAMLAAFAFGLACGTASCLQEQNSVLKLEDVYDLYNKEGRPIFNSSHKMP